MPSERAPLRGARALVFAAACVAVSGAGHSLVAGAPVPLRGYALGMAVMLAVGLLAAGRERSGPTIAAALFAGETGLHALFQAVTPQVTAMPGMAMPASTATGSGAPGGMAMPGHPVWGCGLDMMLVHLLAALVAGWWLRSGERAVFAQLRAMAARGGLATAVLAALRRGRLRPPRLVVPIPAARVTRQGVSRPYLPEVSRGPPLGMAC